MNVLPGSVVPLAPGHWSGNFGEWMLSWQWCQGHMIAGWPGKRNNISWLGARVNRGLTPWDLSEIFLSVYPSWWSGSPWTISIFTGIKGLSGCWIMQLWSISLGDGMLGAIDVDCSSSRMVSRDVLSILGSAECSLQHLHLLLYETIQMVEGVGMRWYDQWTASAGTFWILLLWRGVHCECIWCWGTILGYDLIKSLDTWTGLTLTMTCRKGLGYLLNKLAISR